MSQPEQFAIPRQHTRPLVETNIEQLPFQRRRMYDSSHAVRSFIPPEDIATPLAVHRYLTEGKGRFGSPLARASLMLGSTVVALSALAGVAYFLER